MIDYTLLIVIAFFAFTLIHGLLSARGVDTFQKFTVGDKNFKTATLVATLVATYFGGGFMFRSLEQIYTKGLYYVLMTGGDLLDFLIMGQLLIPRMQEFLKHLSIAESMGTLFGMPIRIITAIVAILSSAPIIAIQFQVITKVVHMFFPIKGDLLLYVALVITVGYSIWGGIRAVTFTDIVQFLTFAAFMPILIYVVGQQVPIIKSITTLFTTHENFNVKQVIGWHPKFRDTLQMFLLFSIPCISPAFMQRFYMSSSVWQAKRVFSYSTLIFLVMYCTITILAMLLLAHNMHLDPTKLVDHMLALYPAYWFKGLVCIGILALVLSTADSLLNITSILFANDIAPSLKLLGTNKLLIARLSTFLTGVLAYWFAFKIKDLLDLLMVANSIYMPVVTVPFLMAVLGFRPRTISVLIGMGAGGLTVIGFEYFHWGAWLGIRYGTFPAVLMNLLFLVGSHYLFPKAPNRGWVGIKEKEPLIQATQERKRKWRAWKQALKHFNIKYYLQSIFPNARTISLVGIYIFFIIGLLQLFTLNNFYRENNIGFFIFSMIMGMLLFLYPLFSTDQWQTHRLLIYGWPILINILFYVLPGYLMHIYDYQVIPSLVFLMNIGIGLLLFPWVHILSMVVMSLFIVHKMTSYNGFLDRLFALQNSWETTSWNFVLVLFFFLVLYIILIRYRQKLLTMVRKANYLAQEKSLQAAEKLSHMQYQHHLDLLTSHQGKEDVLKNIKQELDVLLKNPKVGSQEKVKIQTSLDRLSSYREFIQDRHYYERQHLLLSPSIMSISSLVDKVVHDCELLHLNIKPLIYQETKREQLECDAKKIEELICKSVAWIYEKEQPKNKREYLMKLYIMDSMLGYSLNKTGSVYKELAAIAFVVTSSPQVPKPASVYAEETCQNEPIMLETSSDLNRQRMLQIVDAHYGYCTDIIESEGITLLHVVPVALHEIRDAVMDRLPHFPDCKMVETAASLAKEQEVTKLIVSKTLLSRSYVASAIDFMKKCHGDQLRHSGEPFYTHPLEVAAIVLKETQDSDAVVAALLHDVIEDSTVPLSYIRGRFGSAVSFIVNKMTHMDDSFRKKRLSKAEDAAQLADVDVDIRVVQVKLADRLHNVRTLKYCSIEKQRELAEETLAFYVPLGERYHIPFVEEMKRLCEWVMSRYQAR